MTKKYRASDSLAFTGALIFGLCGIVYVLVSIREGTFYKALWVHAIYFSLVVLFYYGAKYGTYITVTEEKIRGYAFFIPGLVTQIKDIIALEEVLTFAGQITHIQMQVIVKKHKKKRGLVAKETLSKNNLRELIIEIQKINPSIIIPSSLLK